MVGIKFVKKPFQKGVKKTLVQVLHDHLTGFDPPRSTVRLHASSVTNPDGFCPRFHVLSILDPSVLKDRWLTTSEAVTFAIGNDLQNRIVEWMAQTKRTIGDWKCPACETMMTFQKKPQHCIKCGCSLVIAEEVRVVSEVSGISCGLDLIVDLGAPKFTLVEIKTMSNDKFKDLKGPLAEHKQRTQLYLRCVAESALSDFVDTSEAHVLYVTKGGYGISASMKEQGISDKFSPFKEFVVQRDDAAVEYLVTRAKAVKTWDEGNGPIPEGICATPMASRAQSCSACKLCFSEKYAPTNLWMTGE